jgi:hypothetical protein
MLDCGLMLFVSFVEARHELELCVEHYICMVVILKGLVTVYLCSSMRLLSAHEFSACKYRVLWVYYIIVLVHSWIVHVQQFFIFITQNFTAVC